MLKSTVLVFNKFCKRKIMAVKLRMTRIGRRHRPFFRINAVESRTPRDGKILEKLGHYDPIEKDPARQIVLNRERTEYWLDKGAIPSDTVSQILLRQGIKHKYAEQKVARQAKARAIAGAKGKLFNKAQRIAAKKEVIKTEAEAKTKEAEEKAKAATEAKTKEAEVKAEAEAAAEKAKAEEAAKTKEAEEKAKVEAEAKAKAEEKIKAEAEAQPEPEAKPETETAEEKVEAKTEAVRKGRPRSSSRRRNRSQG
jgi:small subunit ribosomal protein S16